MSGERAAKMPYWGNFDSVPDVPGFDPEQEIKLKVITFSGHHDCGTPTLITLTMRGNPGQSLEGMAYILDFDPPQMCEGCGLDLAGTRLMVDPQHGANPVM